MYKIGGSSLYFSCVYLPWETGESIVNMEKMVRRVILEAAIMEEELQLYFLTHCCWFSYRSLHYLPKTFFFLCVLDSFVRLWFYLASRERSQV